MKSAPIPTRTSRPKGAGYRGGELLFKGIALALATLCLLAAGPLPAGSAGNPLQETARFTPGVTEAMVSADFWISRIAEPDKVLMTADGIARFNRDLDGRFDFMRDIERHPELSREEARSLIEANPLPYGKGRLTAHREPARDSFYDGLKRELNLPALPEQVKPVWGVTVRRSAIRSFPTAEPSFSPADRHGFDLFQETEADIWTPLAILHESQNGRWAFVQIYHYNGWMKREDIAVAADPGALFALLSRKEFLVATGSWVESQAGPDGSRARFMMGTRIPLLAKEEIPAHLTGQNPQANYAVWLPSRDAKGLFSPVMALVSAAADVHPGFLPCTRRSLLTQAFKMAGERYSWGGSFEGRDCSRLIVDIFRTVGIMLPRNAGQQARAGVDRFERPAGERFAHLEPGACLYMPGHAMLYIGHHGGRSYILHSTAGFRNLPGEAVRPVLSVVVSDLSVLAEGIRTITAAREFTLPR